MRSPGDAGDKRMLERVAEFLRKRNVNFDTFGTVFDIGSRDGLQAIELSDLFRNAQVFAVECNRDTLDDCRRNIASRSRIRLIDKAINSYTGRCLFHPIDREKTVTTWPDGNPGASSLFLATGDYPAEKYVQNTVEVDCIRLDVLCGQLGIDVVDFIWMDLQGAELIALQSAGPLLEKVRYIFTEVSHKPLYNGQCLFDDVDAYLKAKGFRCCTNIKRNRWQQDVIYENTRDLIDVAIPLGPNDWGTFDVSLRSVRNFVRNVRHIYVVAAEDPKSRNARYVDERQFPFDIEEVNRGLNSGKPGGHYFQQLVKLYFPLVYPHCLDHVLAVDADTIFLRPCRFVDGGRPAFNLGDEDRPAYFEHLARLHPSLRRLIGYSGKTHCMPLKRGWLAELHKLIEGQHGGVPFWKAYLQAVDPEHIDDGASEAEIYLNFCLMNHSADLMIRRLHWMEASDADEIDPEHCDYVNLDRRLRTKPIDRQQLERRIFPEVAIGA